MTSRQRRQYHYRLLEESAWTCDRFVQSVHKTYPGSLGGYRDMVRVGHPSGVIELWAHLHATTLQLERASIERMA